MGRKFSSRERMMAAIECQETDYVPLCFMIFSALGSKCRDYQDFVDKQLEMGLDAVVDLPINSPEATDLRGLPVKIVRKITRISRRLLELCGVERKS